ncbi:hypothetical protein QW060_06795 [Myroides ceti]|uniref:Uncharacterized protein n=1 Tax=Paenimyroides ceti TaxID=395087 RepID=A0ABT8CUH8_9FLAO|nr:hypothetical protein [Paenimyroides ceti]MDN3706837.1 hypothetical protein [Paenimyroides ceti]
MQKNLQINSNLYLSPYYKRQANRLPFIFLYSTLINKMLKDTSCINVSLLTYLHHVFIPDFH